MSRGLEPKVATDGTRSHTGETLPRLSSGTGGSVLTYVTVHTRTLAGWGGDEKDLLYPCHHGKRYTEVDLIVHVVS